MRPIVITADSHAGPPPPAYRDYFDPEHRDALEGFIAKTSAIGDEETRHAKQHEDQFGGDLFSVEWGGREGAWNPEVRRRELEAQGVVGDVVFPDGQNDNPLPFAPYTGDYPAELQMAGARAFNRWLADFCATAPARHAGVAVVPLHDIDWAVAEIRAAREAGLRGGIFVSPWNGELPFYHHPRYEPVWRTCAELAMPVNFHSSPEHPDYGDHPGSVAIFASEVAWYSHRPLWFLLWSGVFERYPDLRIALVEQSASWVPYTLGQLDSLYDRPYFSHFRDGLPLRPSEYWARQCVVSGFIDAREFAMRDQIGVECLLWGSDYPHIEGIGDCQANLRKVMGGAPDSDIRRVLSDNAAALYGFDLDVLRPIADRVGPTL